MRNQTAAISIVAEPLDGPPETAELSAEAACSPERFVAENYGRVYAWFWWLCGRRELAADLTQETFAAYWESLRRRRVREPRAWLLRIARNRWRKRCREQRSRRGARSPRSTMAHVPEPASPARDDPAESAANSEGRHRLRALVEALPTAYREAVVLRFWADLSYREIGIATGAPAALARWRVHRGKALLRDRMNAQGWNLTGERP